ncbi:MAG: phosphocholine-specific phospholipase C [Terriglobales bacterium]
MSLSRRSFLQALGAGAAGAAFPASIARALAIPARRRTGTIADVGHVVILMQENRSFDHMFGTLRGVRGFGDRRAARLASGAPVWQQPRSAPDDANFVLPFHPGAPNLGLRFLEDLAHDWTSTQAAWRDGHYDQWIPQKGSTAMAHLVRADIPYHYALADAFTICDAYYCSVLGPTDPNRYHMFTGWAGNDGRGGGPVLGDEEAGYSWTTFPERLERAGVSWKVYQDIGGGLEPRTHWGFEHDPYIGNYGDNSLLYFRQYQQAAPGSALRRRAMTGSQVMTSGTLFDQFRRDARAGRLPQVSWVVAPEAYCEHPNWPANYGAWYVSQILDALTANAEVWSQTALFVTYDENDGFFDHLVPPTPPMDPSQGHSSVDSNLEIFGGDAHYPRGPYGLGVRVPMLVISPWSKGGWVDSEVFDHTSLLRFLERRFGPGHAGLEEINITPWRRAVCGDLTSAFDFGAANAAWPPFSGRPSDGRAAAGTRLAATRARSAQGASKWPREAVVSLPPTAAYAPPDRERHADYKPLPPAEQAMPVQEPGTRPARALPYALEVRAVARPDRGAVELQMHNAGRTAAVLQVRSANGETPRSYTLLPSERWTDHWAAADSAAPTYGLSVHGPNGFFRLFEGRLGANAGQGVESWLEAPPGQPAVLHLENGGAQRRVRMAEGYSRKVTMVALDRGQHWRQAWPLDASQGWYELTLTCADDPGWRRQLAGHVESGEASRSEPELTGAGAAAG